jgi:hypothetical protein
MSSRECTLPSPERKGVEFDQQTFPCDSLSPSSIFQTAMAPRGRSPSPRDIRMPSKSRSRSPVRSPARSLSRSRSRSPLSSRSRSYSRCVEAAVFLIHLSIRISDTYSQISFSIPQRPLAFLVRLGASFVYVPSPRPCLNVNTTVHQGRVPGPGRSAPSTPVP